jgi:molybdopterin molybdotransferase
MMFVDLHEALELALKSAQSLGVEKVDFQDSLNRVLAQDIVSRINIPPFNKSAMDGYAVKTNSNGRELRVLDTISAGDSRDLTLQSDGEAYKIMTGAKVPSGAEVVVMKEQVEQIDESSVLISENASRKDNILKMGEDLLIGDVAIRKDTLIKAEHIAVLATLGRVEVEVYKQPKIAVISTGDELIEPNEQLSGSKIRNSNAYQSIAQLAGMNIKADYLGIAKDNMQDSLSMLKRAFDKYDIVVSSGAVSVGDFDFVPKAVESLGFEFIFHGINVKPGKRTLFATKGNKYFIGVPGNPVSSFVQLEVLFKPFFYKLMNLDYKSDEYQFEINFEFKRKHSSRLSFEPVKIVSSKIEKIDYNGSANITAIVNADGFMIVEKGIDKIEKNSKVNVRLI